MKTNDSQTMELATKRGLSPADFPIGSPHSRAAARNLADERAACAMQDWIVLRMDDPKGARAFAKKLERDDPANPIKTRIVVRSHETEKQAERARNSLQSPPGHVSLDLKNDAQGIRFVRLLAARHDVGVVIYVDLSVEKAGRK